jgi:type IV secretion system protein VirD4
MLSRLLAALCRLSFVVATSLAFTGLLVLTLRFPAFVLLAALGIAWWRARRFRGSTWSHGSATIAPLATLERAHMLEGKGVILGRPQPERPGFFSAVGGLYSPRISSEAACRRFLAFAFGPHWYEDRMLMISDYCHLLTCAPAGAGKGTDVLIPNLLSCPINSVVVDPKGELFAQTSEHRRKKFRHRIIRLDPFSLMGPGGDSLNPFDFLDEHADVFLDACRDLASMMILREPQEKDRHWNDSAELNLTALTAFVCGCEANRAKRTLSTVRALASSRTAYAESVKWMRRATAAQGVIARLGGLLTWFTGEELSSVLTTFQRHTAFLDSPAVARNVASSSFDPMILRHGKATVYLILPAERLVSLAPLQRMWIGTLMNVITRGQPTERNPVLWWLDEMAHIGRMDAIENAVTLKRGMGMRLWFFFQSLEQLKTTFGDKATTVLDNIATQQYFGLTSYETADYISKRIGDATISIRSGGGSASDSRPTGSVGAGGGGGNHTSGTNYTLSDTSRRIFKPEEILTLPRDTALVFHKNLPVITARLLRHFNAPEFVGGGTGRQRGLSAAALLAAALTLPVSLAFALWAATLPAPAAMPLRPVTPAYRQAVAPLPQPIRYQRQPLRAPARSLPLRRTRHY